MSLRNVNDISYASANFQSITYFFKILHYSSFVRLLGALKTAHAFISFSKAIFDTLKGQAYPMEQTTGPKSQLIEESNCSLYW